MPVLRTNPRDKLLLTIDGILRRLGALERNAVSRSTPIVAASGAKAQLAVFDDGKVGVRVWDSAGVLQHDLTS